jgi:hypothetical protein
MIISLTSISAILIVVICLSTTNTTPANGSLVKNVKNDTSLKNLMALLISNGGSVNNNITNINYNSTTRSSAASHQQQQQNKQSALSIVGSMRENGNNLTATARPPLNANSTYYTFTKNRSEVSTPENNSHTNEYGKGIKIALINPSFTSAAYNNSYYNFYEKYANTPSRVNVTSEPNLLSSGVSSNQKELSSASGMVYLLKNIKWLTSQSNITLLTDANVDNGNIFNTNSSSSDVGNNSSSSRNSSSNAYDLIILGHQEYVTQQEYDNLKHYVANGGTMIILPSLSMFTSAPLRILILSSSSFTF